MHERENTVHLRVEVLAELGPPPGLRLVPRGGQPVQEDEQHGAR
jgi:hypothetical protein